MRELDGAGVRALVGALPPHVFDDVVDTLPELLEHLHDWQVHEYVHWYEYTSSYGADDVAKEYDYDSMEDMIEQGPYVMLYDDGVLVLE